MKSLIIAAALAVSATIAVADPVEGIWKTQPDDGAFATIEMTQCGAKICGAVKQAYNMQGQPIASDQIGRQIVWDMEPQGGGLYENGKILQPSSGRTYDSKMQLNGSTLEVSGCVFGICRGQTWSR